MPVLYTLGIKIDCSTNWRLTHDVCILYLQIPTTLTSPHCIFLAMIVSHQSKILVADYPSQTIHKALQTFIWQRELKEIPVILTNLTFLLPDDSYAK